MHCNLHDCMGAMRADRLSVPPFLALASHGIAAIGASGYPKLFIVMRWVKPASTEGADIQNGIVYLRSIVTGGTRFMVRKGYANVWASGLLSDDATWKEAA